MPDARKAIKASFMKSGLRAVQFTMLTLACFWLFACQARAASATSSMQSPLFFLAAGAGLLVVATVVHFWRRRSATKRRRS